MSEIRMDVDLEHPVERVWRALTEKKLLSQWLDLPSFAPADEIDVTGIEEPRRVAMLWGTDVLHTRLVWELAPTSDGSQLMLRQSCVFGEWDDELREELREAYEQVLNERLPAVLDWLAFGEVDFTEDQPPAPFEPVPIPFVAPRARRRGRVLVVSACLAAALSAVAVLAMLLRPGGSPAGAPPAPPVPSATSPSTSTPAASTAARADRAARPSEAPSVEPSRAGAARTEGVAVPAAPALSARYETVTSRLFGYRGGITVVNSGKAAASDWTVTITLREAATVTGASGATYRQEGSTVTFTGAAVAAGASHRFEFEVADATIGAKGPTSCEVDGQACS